MENINIFKSYYMKYLGVSLQDMKKGRNVFQCSQREKTINNWYFQHLIVTNINGTNTFSITPMMYTDFYDYITNFKNIDINKLSEILKIFFDGRFQDYSIRKMYRMALDSIPKNLILGKVPVKLTKEILFNSLQGLSDGEKNKILIRKENEINQGRQYVILENDKIVSYCKVSDIDYNGGNLTIYTDPRYRNKGYGKLVTIGAVKWCYENNILPIYWVDEKNTSSISLAKALGFKVKSEEIVVGTDS